jgi:hypothetical protein
LERRLPRGGIAYFLEFLTLKSFLTYLPVKQRGANRPPPPIGKRVNGSNGTAYTGLSLSVTVLLLTEMLLAVLQSDIDKSSSWVAPLENEIVT